MSCGCSQPKSSRPSNKPVLQIGPKPKSVQGSWEKDVFKGAICKKTFVSHSQLFTSWRFGLAADPSYIPNPECHYLTRWQSTFLSHSTFKSQWVQLAVCLSTELLSKLCTHFRHGAQTRSSEQLLRWFNLKKGVNDIFLNYFWDLGGFLRLGLQLTSCMEPFVVFFYLSSQGWLGHMLFASLHSLSPDLWCRPDWWAPPGQTAQWRRSIQTIAQPIHLESLVESHVTVRLVWAGLLSLNPTPWLNGPLGAVRAGFNIVC